MISYTDKASQLYLLTVETAVTKIIAKDPWGTTSPARTCRTTAAG